MSPKIPISFRLKTSPQKHPFLLVFVPKFDQLLVSVPKSFQNERFPIRFRPKIGLMSKGDSYVLGLQDSNLGHIYRQYVVIAISEGFLMRWQNFTFGGREIINIS